jgi:hypothetical protein
VDAHPAPSTHEIFIRQEKSYSYPPNRSGCRIWNRSASRRAAITSFDTIRASSADAAFSRNKGTNARARSSNSSGVGFGFPPVTTFSPGKARFWAVIDYLNQFYTLRRKVELLSEKWTNLPLSPPFKNCHNNGNDKNKCQTR